MNKHNTGHREGHLHVFFIFLFCFFFFAAAVEAGYDIQSECHRNPTHWSFKWHFDTAVFLLRLWIIPPSWFWNMFWWLLKVTKAQCVQISCWSSGMWLWLHLTLCVCRLTYSHKSLFISNEWSSIKNSFHMATEHWPEDHTVDDNSVVHGL